MNNNIKYFILGLAVLCGLTACNKQLAEESQAPVNTHRVYFSTATAETRTGITIEEDIMTPDWRKTQAGNVHLFEMGSRGYAEGEDVKITLSEENQIAHFQADFPTDMTIIVDPSKKNLTLNASNESNAGPYTYAAIVAQAKESAYIVPAIQHPDTETLIDPDADFLIGYSRKSYDAAHNWEEDVVDLYFDRPVALGRIIVSSFEEGEKVKSVVIKAPGLSGSAAYTAIDFESATVTFTPDEAAEGETAALTLEYGAGATLADDGTFGAYFVALPGKAQISEIVVTTDKWVYTKTVGKEITLSKDSFKNLTLNLSTATKEAAAPTEIKWYKASVLEDGIDYIIVSAGFALKNNGSESVVSAESVEIVDETITIEETEGIVWTADANADFAEYGSHVLSNGTEHLWRHSDNGTFTLEASSAAITKYMVWNYDGEYLWNISIYTGSGSSTISDYYAYYSSGWKTSTTKTAATLYTRRAPQAMTFSESTVNYDVDAGGDFIKPALEGAMTAVTYSSSNDAVASVDSATGEVTIKKAGTAVITAVAAGNTEYQAGTACYTIIATSSSIDTFYLASEIVAGESYMIVSGGKAMVVDGSTIGTVDVMGTGEATIQIPVSEISLFKAAEHIEYYTGTSPAGHYTLSFGEMYLQRKSEQSTQTVVVGDIPSTKKYYVWEYDGEHLYHISSASNTFYLGYDAGWVFKYSNTLPITYLYTTTKQLLPQHLSFASESVSVVLGEPFTAPALEGAHTTVTWTSSDEGVATVASDGTVTLVGKGTTTITATAAANDEYNAGSASYTLKVTDGSVSIWYKTEEIEDGQSYIVISNGSALKNSSGSLAAETNSLFTGDSFQYEAESDLIWLVTGNSSSFTLTNDGKYLRRSGSSGLQISSTNSSNACTYDGSYVKIASSYVLYCNNGSWTTGNSTSDSRKVSFYTSTPPRQTQTLSFSATSVNHDIAGSAAFTAPSLSGALTTVTYSSSKETVATVDLETGAVEIVGVGTTTITASAEGTTEYKPATASYTLHVTDSNAPVTTTRYVLASSIEAGKEYLIVSNGMALQNNNKAEGAYPVTVENSQIELDDDTASSLLWTASADGDRYNFSNDSSFLVRNSNSIVIGEKNSTARYNQWALDDSNYLGAATGGTTLYTLGYDSSSSTWTAKDGNSVNASLYTAE